MVAGKLIVIPTLGHQNKGKSSFAGSSLFVLMSQGGNNNELARHHVPCDRLLQKAYSSRALFCCKGIQNNDNIQLKINLNTKVGNE